jgi:hypothetical protein
MTTPKVARPERVVRFYVAGEAVNAERFWEEVRRMGGTATIVAHDPQPVGYTLTEKGAAALRPQEGREDA